jgi:Ser/Thr protein kinase RdoA (MazF antagonist)
MLWAPRVSEIAIAATHQCVREADPLAAASDVVAAYDKTSPLDAAEIALVPRLIALRLTMAMLLQRAHAAASGSRHFDLTLHGIFYRALLLLSEIGWNACAQRMLERVQEDGERG